MATLIERNDVINYLRNEVTLGTFMKRTMRTADEACWSICTGIITKVPRVDAEPVKHAKWIYSNDFHWYVASCNKCGYQRRTDIKAEGWNQWNYCPNCGARMDEE